VNLVSLEDGVDSMILVSCPSSFAGIDFNFWRPEMLSDLKDNFSCHWEGKGARPGHLFLPKFKPVDRISKIKNIPVLFIHGDKDWIVNAYHSEKLFKACTTRKKLEIIKNGLHAERLIQQYPERIKKIILDWFSSTMS